MSKLTYDEIPKPLQRFKAEEWTDDLDQHVKAPWSPEWLPAKRWRDAVEEWARSHNLSEDQIQIMLWQCDPFDDRPIYGRFKNIRMDWIEAQVVGVQPPHYPLELEDVEPEFELPEEDEGDDEDGFLKKVIKAVGRVT